MHVSSRIIMTALAAGLAIGPWTAPTTQAADDYTNEIVAFGLLGAVIGILVYVGWKMDEDDKRYPTELSFDSEGDGLRLVYPSAREGEQIAALGYGLSF